MKQSKRVKRERLKSEIIKKLKEWGETTSCIDMPFLNTAWVITSSPGNNNQFLIRRGRNDLFHYDYDRGSLIFIGTEREGRRLQALYNALGLKK